MIALSVLKRKCGSSCAWSARRCAVEGCLSSSSAHALALRLQLVLENSGDAYDKSIDKELDAEAVDVEEVSPHNLRTFGAPAQRKSYSPQKIKV